MWVPHCLLVSSPVHVARENCWVGGGRSRVEIRVEWLSHVTYFVRVLGVEGRACQHGRRTAVTRSKRRQSNIHSLWCMYEIVWDSGDTLLIFGTRSTVISVMALGLWVMGSFPVPTPCSNKFFKSAFCTTHSVSGDARIKNRPIPKLISPNSIYSKQN